MALDDEGIEKLAKALYMATQSHEQGVRIDDSMTYGEAKLLNFGRTMSDLVRKRKTKGTTVVDARSRFTGAKK